MVDPLSLHEVVDTLVASLLEELHRGPRCTRPQVSTENDLIRALRRDVANRSIDVVVMRDGYPIFNRVSSAERSNLRMSMLGIYGNQLHFQNMEKVN